MGSNKLLHVIIVLLLVIVVGGGIYIFLNRQGASTETPPPTGEPAAGAVSGGSVVPEALSEQPDQAKYNEYLKSIYLGKMAIGKTIGVDGFPAQTNVFTPGVDLFCTMMELKKTIPSGDIATAVYDTAAKVYDQQKMVFPIELKAGGSGGCTDLTQLAGKYEYKLYVQDVLVSVLPFEVR